MDYIIYATFVVIFISMGTVVILYSSYIKAKAWAALSLDSKKNIAEAAVTYAALTNIKKSKDDKALSLYCGCNLIVELDLFYSEWYFQRHRVR